MKGLPTKLEIQGSPFIPFPQQNKEPHIYERIILILSLLFCSQLITASNLLIEAESFDQKEDG